MDIESVVVWRRIDSIRLLAINAWKELRLVSRSSDEVQQADSRRQREIDWPTVEDNEQCKDEAEIDCTATVESAVHLSADKVGVGWRGSAKMI